MRVAFSRWWLLHVLTHFTATWRKQGTRCVPWSTSARAAWRAGESRPTTNIASCLTHLCSASDAQGCSNVSCDVFYKRHAAQVRGFLLRLSRQTAMFLLYFQRKAASAAAAKNAFNMANK
jgi:hypothetical protein